MDHPLIITPQTKVLALIEAYPALEDVLIARVPAFSRLRNPVLRRTVARIATLQQAAAVGGIGVDELVNLLRREVGQDLYSGGSGTAYVTVRPDWFDEAFVGEEVDAGAMLSAGEQPVHRVLSELQALPPGGIYKLVVPFVPAPLIDKATSLGIRHYLVREADDRCVVYFSKR